MKRLGLVIQGPLVSVGNEGRKAHISKKVLGERGFVRFDCRENISRMINEFGDLFDSIVISTWDAEVRTDDIWPGARLISMSDPGEIQREVYSLRSRNKYRQFIGIRNGLSELEKSSQVEYVVRTRTDTYINLRDVVNSFFKSVEISNQSEMIGVPLMRPVDYFIHDFYFIGEFSRMKRFCDAVVSFDMHEFISCVHRDSVLKYAYAEYSPAIQVPDWAYFPYWPASGASAETKKIFNYMFQKAFVALDPEIFRTLKWRGTLLSESHVKHQLGNVGLGLVGGMLDVPGFVSTNWKSFFIFLEKRDGRKISFKDHLVISTGNFSWKVWNLIKKVAWKTKITAGVKRFLKQN